MVSRSQRHLRARRGYDEFGSTDAPGSSYARDWRQTLIDSTASFRATPTPVLSNLHVTGSSGNLSLDFDSDSVCEVRWIITRDGREAPADVWAGNGLASGSSPAVVGGNTTTIAITPGFSDGDYWLHVVAKATPDSELSLPYTLPVFVGSTSSAPAPFTSSDWAVYDAWVASSAVIAVWTHAFPSSLGYFEYRITDTSGGLVRDWTPVLITGLPAYHRITGLPVGTYNVTIRPKNSFGTGLASSQKQLDVLAESSSMDLSGFSMTLPVSSVGAFSGGAASVVPAALLTSPPAYAVPWFHHDAGELKLVVPDKGAVEPWSSGPETTLEYTTSAQTSETMSVYVKMKLVGGTVGDEVCIARLVRDAAGSISDDARLVYTVAPAGTGGQLVLRVADGLFGVPQDHVVTAAVDVATTGEAVIEARVDWYPSRIVVYQGAGADTQTASTSIVVNTYTRDHDAGAYTWRIGPQALDTHGDVTAFIDAATWTAVQKSAGTAPNAFTSGDFTAVSHASIIGAITLDVLSLPDTHGFAIDKLEYRLDGGAPVEILGFNGVGVYDVTGLVPGTQYDVELRVITVAGVSAWSPTKQVTARMAPPSLITPPSVSYNAATGAELVVSPGSWVGADSFTYEWLHGNTVLSTTTLWTPDSSYWGKHINVRVTATGPGGSSVAYLPSSWGVAGPPKGDVAFALMSPTTDGFTINVTALATTEPHAPITDMLYAIDGGTPVSMNLSTTGTYMVTGLNPNQQYSVRLVSRNRIGDSVVSPGQSITTDNNAVAPTNTTPPGIQFAGATGVDLSVVPGVWSGTQPITYSREWLHGTTVIATGDTWTPAPAEFGWVVTVKETATNSAGSAPATSAQFTVPNVPDAPAAPTVSVSGTDATVTVGSITDNGAPVTLIEYQLDGGAWIDTGLTATGNFQITGLTIGNHSVAVRASNRMGASAASAATAFTVADTTAPVLSAPGATPVGSDAFTLQIDTDTAEGTIYWILTTDTGTPTAAQVKAGQDATGSAAPWAGQTPNVTSTGTQTITTLSLLPGNYYMAVMHEDVAGNQSTVVTAGPANVAGVIVSNLREAVNQSSYGVILHGDLSQVPAGGVNVYSVGVAAGSPAPSAAQIQLGHDATGATALFSQTKTGMSAGVDLVLINKVNQCNPSLTYDIYFAFEDAAAATLYPQVNSFTGYQPPPPDDVINSISTVVTAPGTVQVTVDMAVDPQSIYITAFDRGDIESLSQPASHVIYKWPSANFIAQSVIDSATSQAGQNVTTLTGLPTNSDFWIYVCAGISSGKYYGLIEHVGPMQAADTTAPTLTKPVWDAANGKATMTSDEAGTLFHTVNSDPTPMAGSAIETADGTAGVSVPATTTTPFTVDLSGQTQGATVYLHVTVKDSSGNYATDVPASILVPDVTAPTLASTTPADNATGVATTSAIVLTFSEPVQLGTGSIELYDVTNAAVVETFDVAAGTGSAGGTVAASGTDVTITPGAAFANSTDYAIRTIPGTAITDTAGNAFAGWTNDVTQLNWTTVAASAGISFGGTSTAESATVKVGSVTIPVPAGISSGDTLVIAVGHLRSRSIAAQDGWTPVGSIEQPSGISRGITVLTKTVPAGGLTDQTLAFSGGTSKYDAIMLAVSGASAVALDSTGTGTSGTTLTGASVAATSGEAVMTAFLTEQTLSGTDLLGQMVSIGNQGAALFGTVATASGSIQHSATAGTAEYWAHVTMKVT